MFCISVVDKHRLMKPSGRYLLTLWGIADHEYASKVNFVLLLPDYARDPN